MGIKELLDEEEFDPKKLFNEEEYSTLIIKRDGFSKKENGIADLIEELLEEGNSRQNNERIFADLKTQNAGQMLIDAIKTAEKPSDLAKIIAACWESGLDFSKECALFASFVYAADFQVALEALSVVEGIENLPPDEVETILQSLHSKKGSHNDLITDLTHHLNQLKNA